ncbi:hypothetical protein [Methylocella sp.]|uniref:hypothetical protein n=1 Tax=Methylocella sp. TaxID=1978226 RepID=UPI003783B597
MNNAAIVAVTSLALVAGSVGLEAARRKPAAAPSVASVAAPTPSATSADLGSGAVAPAAAEAEEAPPSRAVIFPVASEAAWTKTAAAELPQEPAPVRDAAPPPAPSEHADALSAPGTSEAAAPAPEATKDASAQPRAPEASAPQPKSVERRGAAPADEPRVVRPAPAARSHVALRAPAPREAVEARPRRIRPTREPETARAEPFHTIYAARWPGAPAQGALAQPTRFSGVFAGCRYRGVVSPEGYRIESAC